MTTSSVKLRALVFSTLLAFSMLAAPVSFAPTGVAAAANTTGNVGISINDAGNQATVTIDDPDLNAAGNTAETHLVNVEAEQENPTWYATTSSDTPDSDTQIHTIKKGWTVADRNNDGSITKADFTLQGASDESIASVAANNGAYDVTISDGSGSSDGYSETIQYTKLSGTDTGTDTLDGTSPTIKIASSVGDRNGDGVLDTSDFELRNAAADESIASVSRNADGTVDVTIEDSGNTDDGSESPAGSEQLVYLSTETVELSETGKDTGTFTGSIALGTTFGTAGELKAESGDYVRAIYWGDGTETTTTDALGDGSPPTAELQVFPSSVTKGQPAYLDGSGSSDDLSNNIKTYEWDVDADGNYEYSTTTAFKQHAFPSVGSTAVTLRVTDYAGKTSTSQQLVDVKAPANVESTSVEHTGNGTVPSTMPKVATESAAGMLRLHLYHGSSESNRDLSAVGVDESTELWVNVTFTNYDPDAMMGGAAVDSWQTSTTKDGDTTLAIKMHPIRMQRLSTVTTYSPGRWPSNNQQADVAITPGAHLATFDMPDGSQFESDMTGATLTSDAQVFSPPMYDRNTGELTYSVAAPHWNKNGKKVDSNTNTGFYEATIPSGMVTRMGIDDPGELSGTYTSGGSTEDLSNMQVEETSSGGLYINVTGIHYSSGDIKLEADTTDPTANAGSDQTVDEDSSTAFDGTGSSDNRQVQTYEWDWDDDGTYESTGATPSHTFADPGTYTVTLRVTDGADNTDTDTLSVTVEDVAETSSSSSDDDDELTPRPTPTPEPTSTPEPKTTATSTPASTATAADTSTATVSATPGPTETTAGTETSDGAGVAADEPTAQGTAGAAGPGFGPVATVVALLGAALLARRRR